MLVIGLGNPGTTYEKTRHNVGFMVLDAISQAFDFPEFSFSKKHNALVSKGMIHERTTTLAKPQTFMNNSGKSVQSLAKQDKDLLVIHDDIDLPIGTLRISENRGSAGHKGVESIIQTLGTKNFKRLRIGIQPKKGKPEDTESFVLKQFSKAEQSQLKEVISQAVLLFETSLQKKEGA